MDLVHNYTVFCKIWKKSVENLEYFFVKKYRKFGFFVKKCRKFGIFFVKKCRKFGIFFVKKCRKLGILSVKKCRKCGFFVKKSVENLQNESLLNYDYIYVDGAWFHNILEALNK